MRVGFDVYSTAYQHVQIERDDAGVVLLRMHTAGRPLLWGSGPHTELGYCFQDVGSDPDNRVVIITGTRDRFIAGLDESWVGPMSPPKWDKILQHGGRLLNCLMDIEVPVIAAVNGPARIHAELAVLSDIVLAANNADFQDLPHFVHGTVPGDGVHLIWPHLIGENRGRYFLLTGQRLSATEALQLGVVSEVLAPEDLLARAYELAHKLCEQPDTTLRYARTALMIRWKKLLSEGLAHGLALEGLGAYASWPTAPFTRPSS